MRINLTIPYVFINLFKRSDGINALIDFLNSILNCNEKIIDLDFLLDNTKYTKCLCENNHRIDTICYFSNGIKKYITVQIVNSMLSLDNTLNFFKENEFKTIKETNFNNNSICITFLNSTFLNGEKYHSIYELNNKSKNMIDELHFIEFSKFNKSNIELLDDSSLENMDSLSKWLIFFKYPESYLTRILEEDNNIRELKTYFYKLILNSTFKNTYDLCEKTMYDEISALNSAKREGLEKGIEIGKEEGLKEGELHTKKKLAKSLLDVLDIETISKKTGLSIDEIKRL
ncbi:TPA: Rpn family recombination-promoting nuclease/putative transposase [Clostridium perfringens]|nr:Rpn family recombination-promoting nuclease/putative transposase [Clostridium perfringens]HBC2058171.1 Rpn family recombination-promoting nuclease/putative transposase [Clostridium perfringens]HBC2072394.1 Rpn family recombination-promoting nuclease/putative transposase [Clostridium perfringens]